MQDELTEIQTRLTQLLEDVRTASHIIGRGPGGRNIAIAITKLEDAEDRLLRAKSDLSISKGEK